MALGLLQVYPPTPAELATAAAGGEPEIEHLMGDGAAEDSRSGKVGVPCSKLELPLDSWWHPTAGVPGWACGHARQPRQTPSRGGSRA
jgi:hypothetical protein